MAKSRSEKPLRLEELSKFRVNLPKEFHASGKVLVYLTNPDGTLQARILDKMPSGLPIDDIQKLQAAKSVVASVENAAKRSDKVNTTNVFLTKMKMDKKEVKPLQQFHTERIKYEVFTNNITRNLADIDTIKEDSQIKALFIQQAKRALDTIDEYLVNLASGKKLDFSELLKNHLCSRWFFDKLSGANLQLRPFSDLEKLLFPEKGIGNVYLTPGEITQLMIGMLQPILNKVSQTLLFTFMDKDVQKILSIDPKSSTKLSEEFRKFRVYLPPDKPIKELKDRFSNIPLSRASSSSFPQLDYMVIEVFRAMYLAPNAEILPEDFFRIVEKTFSYDRNRLERPRAQFFETVKKNDKASEFIAPLLRGTGATRNIFVRALLDRLEPKEGEQKPQIDIPEGKNEAYNRVFINIKLETVTGDPRFLETQREIKEFLLEPPKVRAGANREVHTTLTKKGRTLIDRLEESPKLNGLALGVKNYLQSFLDPYFADQAVGLMLAQLEAGGVVLEETTIESFAEKDDDEGINDAFERIDA